MSEPQNPPGGLFQNLQRLADGGLELAQSRLELLSVELQIEKCRLVELLILAAMFALLNGRIAGVSGVLAGLLTPSKGDVAWLWYWLAIGINERLELALNQLVRGTRFSACFPVLAELTADLE